MTMVILEPELERIAGDLSPAHKAALAARLYRWAKQLWMAAAIESGGAPVMRSRARLYPRKRRRAL
jgi:hypothetical protein